MGTDIETRIVDFIPKVLLVMTIVSACFLSLQNPVRKIIEITLSLIVLTGTSYFVVYGLMDGDREMLYLSGIITLIFGSLLYYYWKTRPIKH